MIEHEGKNYARVSDILKGVFDFSKIDPVVLGRKQVIGTLTHNAIEEYIKGNFPLVEKSNAGYFKSFLAWHDYLQCPFCRIEERFYCDEKRITGKIDGLALFKGEEFPILVDWKTSANQSPTWVLQAHLYHYLLEKNQIPCGSRFLFVQLSSIGWLPKVYEYHFDENTLFKCFGLIEKFWSNQSTPNP